MQQRYFLGCDWGTSSFRLRLFNQEDKRVEAEIYSNQGVANVYKQWQELTNLDSVTQELFFRCELKKQVDNLSSKTQLNFSNATILLSGMASSSIGMKPIPYANAPFSISGSDMLTEMIQADHHLPHDILLVSGVKTETDVIRGEETQLVGMVSLLKTKKIYQGPGIFIFPGTHSKHLYVQDDQLKEINTCMTGELFEILKGNSVLKDSVDSSLLNFETDQDQESFRRGVKAASEKSMLEQLFKVRTNQLFCLLDKRQNTFFLSGLLIGSELSALPTESNVPFLLCSTEKLHGFYKLALDELKLLSNSLLIPSEMMDEATMEGQFIIRNYHIQ